MCRESDVYVVIEKIEVEGLKDTGTRFDPQDPCVVVRIGSAQYKTERWVLKCILDNLLKITSPFCPSCRKVDAGTSALFDEEITLFATDEDIKGEVRVIVMMSLL